MAQIPQCSICGQTKTWHESGVNRQGVPYDGFYGCPNWKNHAKTPQTAPVAQTPNVSHPSVSSATIQSIVTAQSIMQEELVTIQTKLGTIEDLLRQLLNSKI